MISLPNLEILLILLVGHLSFTGNNSGSEILFLHESILSIFFFKIIGVIVFVLLLHLQGLILQ